MACGGGEVNGDGVDGLNGLADTIGAVDASIELRMHGDAQAAHVFERAIRTGQMHVQVSLTGADGVVEHVPIGSVRVLPEHGPTPRMPAKSRTDEVSPKAAVWSTAPTATALDERAAVASTDGESSALQTAQPPLAPDEPPVHRAVIWLSSRLPNAEQVMRMAVVSLDGIPGSQVEGISALYLASGLRDPDATVAVLQLSTMLTAPELDQALSTIALGHEHGIAISVVQFDDALSDSDESVRSAAVLEPWCAMNPDACVAGDPIAYRLALADDADRVGLLSDNWIIGETS